MLHILKLSLSLENCVRNIQPPPPHQHSPCYNSGTNKLYLSATSFILYQHHFSHRSLMFDKLSFLLSRTYLHNFSSVIITTTYFLHYFDLSLLAGMCEFFLKGNELSGPFRHEAKNVREEKYVSYCM